MRSSIQTRFVALLLTGVCASASQLYTVTAIEPPTGFFDYAGNALNNSGQVTGDIDSLNGSHVPLYSNGVVTDLGTLGGASAIGNAINDSGQITGSSGIANGANGPHALLYSNGVMTDLNALINPALGLTLIDGFGINAAGQVTGEATLANGATHAFLYSNGALTDLGTLGGLQNSVGYAINASGQIVGTSYTAYGFGHAFLYRNGVMVDLGSGTARAINASGEVTGDSSNHAFLYSNGVMVHLGTLYGSPFSLGSAINDSGEVVGTSDSSAFVYSNGVMTDLNTLLIDPPAATVLTDAMGINDNGQILADGYFAGQFSGERAFLLTPVPEPMALGLFGLGLWALLLARDKRRGLTN